MYNLRGNNRLKKFIKGRRNFNAKRQSKRLNENGNVRRAVLCDGVYIVPVAVHAGLGDGVDIRAEFDGVSFDAAPNFYSNFHLYINGCSGLAGIRGRTRFEQTFKSGRRLLFRVDSCVFVAEHV